MGEHRSTKSGERGNAKEQFGRIAREAEAQIKEDIADEAELVYDELKDIPARSANIVRRTIEQQPYTAVAIAIAVGWLLGRTHRPI